MNFSVSKNKENELWDIRLETGLLLATAEAVSMSKVAFVGRTLVGNIKGVWGLTNLHEAAEQDFHLLKAMGIGGSFNIVTLEHCGHTKLYLDYDGFFDIKGRKRSTCHYPVANREVLMAKGAV